MRRVRSMIGLLSLGCLVAGLFALLWAYPCWISTYEATNPTAGSVIAKLGLNGPAQENNNNYALRRYAQASVYAYRTRSDWDFLPWVRRSDVTRAMANPIVAAALLNRDGRVIAAYPQALVGRVFPLRKPLDQMSDMDYGDAFHVYSNWTHMIYAAAGVSDERWSYGLMRHKVYDANGRASALLVTVVSQNQRMTVSSGPLQADQLVWLAGMLFVLYWFVLPAWVAMDAAYRGMRPTAWGFLVLVTNWIGLLAYLTARLSPPKPCPNCGEMVLSKFKRCPACGMVFLGVCPVCRTKAKPGWQYCPVCAATPAKGVEQVQQEEQVVQAPTPPPPPAMTPLPAPEPASLSVTVREAGSGNPIANAAVSISGAASLQGLTNRSGVFEARKLRAGQYTVEAARQGYEQAQAELGIDEQSCRAVDLNLNGLPGAVAGRVTDRSTGAPLAGAHIYLDSNRVDRSSLTDESGRFALGEVPAGPYTLRADAEGYASQIKLAEVGPGATVDVSFALDAAAELAAQE